MSNDECRKEKVEWGEDEVGGGSLSSVRRAVALAFDFRLSAFDFFSCVHRAGNSVRVLNLLLPSSP